MNGTTDTTDVKDDGVPQTPESHVDDGRRPTQVLPTDRVGVDKQLRILAAFATSYLTDKQPVSNEKAGRAVSLSAQTVVTTNPFFIACGLMERVGSGLFKVLEPALVFQRAFSWNQATAPAKLAPVFKEQWFGKALLPIIQIRGSISKTEGVQLLAECCSATPKYNGPLTTLLDMMAAVGVIGMEGETITIGAEGMTTRAPYESAQEPPPQPQAEKPVEQPHGDVIPSDAPFMYLDKDKQKRVVIIAPHVVTKKEFDRITKWLEVQLFVEQDSE